MNDYNENLHQSAKGLTYENARHLRKFQTDAEHILWQELRARKLNGFKFRRQHPMDKFVLDFYCHEIKLCIEADGGIHEQEAVREYDADRTRLLNENGISVLRFTNEEIIHQTKLVLEKIVYRINEK